MANLGSQKISSNYQKLLQISESGVVADGSGSYTTLTLSGSQYYTSGSVEPVQSLMALGVTGSIIPEGSGSWDLGSEDNPFKHLFLSNNSLILVDTTKKSTSADRKVALTKEDITDWLSGNFKQKINTTTKARLISPKSLNVNSIEVEPFVFDENDDLVSNNLTTNHIVSDKFWKFNSTLLELETKSIMFRYEAGDSPTNDLIVGG